MKKLILSLVTLLFLSSPALAWNDKGHMVVAKLAWDRLTPAERAAAIGILKAHPHYKEFLTVGRHDNIPDDQWVFMRAATWPDWIRKRQPRTKTWHYINLPYVPPGSELKESDHPAATPNVVTQIAVAENKVKSGTAEEKAVYLCWLLHLVGDIHQPLHATALFNEEFPKGDKGGNLVLVRIRGGKPKSLHPIWDGLLGKPVSWSSIMETVNKVTELEKENQTQFNADLAAAKTPEQWAHESLESAKMFAYLNGSLAVANSANHPAEKNVPNLPDDYLKNAGNVARLAVAKAGRRLAVSLSSVLLSDSLAPPTPETPRESQPKADAGASRPAEGYVASKRSQVFHRAGCKSAATISEKNLVRYATRDEAIQAGKKPCHECNP